MAATKDKKKQGQVWRPATRLVHEGTLASVLATVVLAYTEKRK